MLRSAHVGPIRLDANTEDVRLSYNGNRTFIVPAVDVSDLVEVMRPLLEGQMAEQENGAFRVVRTSVGGIVIYKKLRAGQSAVAGERFAWSERASYDEKNGRPAFAADRFDASDLLAVFREALR